MSTSSSVGKLVILSGPSGVGKDTILNEWMKLNPRVVKVVSYTTRQPRTGEVSGVDYHFVSKDAFLTMASHGAFLEYKEVHGNLYATPKTDMEQLIADGKVAILKIDVQGTFAVTPLRPDALTIFLLPPSSEELERRIRSRGLDDWDAIEKRLDNARAEIATADKYQFRIVNDDVHRVLQELERLIA